MYLGLHILNALRELRVTNIQICYGKYVYIHINYIDILIYKMLICVKT